MATAVDSYFPAAAPPHVLPAVVGGEATGGVEFSCNACSEAFADAAEQRAHCKTERHVYNTKRRLAGLKPICLEAWERKLKESRGAAAVGPNKGTAHLKAGKAPRKGGGDAAAPGDGGAPPPPPPPEASEAGISEANASAREDEGPFSPRRCMFDRRRFEDVEENLQYMWKTYGFSIPDREYCTDVNGLLGALWRKVAEPPHACLYCNRKFQDASSARRHMFDKSHTRVGTEARTRRGRTDEAGSEELKAGLEDFYDFHSSTREVTERIRDPAEKVGCLLRFFDSDKNGRLRRGELAELWAAAQSGAGEGGGAALSEAMYAGACSRAGVAPEEGLDAEALQRLYAEGLADLDEHFAVLQDLLARKLSARTKERARRRLEEAAAVAEEEGEGQEEEETEEGEAVDDEEEDEDEDEEEDDTEDDGSETDVLECDDEDEFEEVMRVLGLQRATITENGDLRLPTGAVAAHRDVAHIWRQRGIRQLGNQLALADGRGSRARFGGKPKAVLMLSNKPASYHVAVSRKEQARDGKRIIAVLRQRALYDFKVSAHYGIDQRKARKIRCGVGDASGGR